MPEADRTKISSFLATIGDAASVAGALGTALSQTQKLYRLDEATTALLKAGGSLAVKDGANLGTVLTSDGLRQARFIPVAALGPARIAAEVGPILAMIALQMKLGEITDLAQTNITLTNQLLTTVRHQQWAELTALATSIDGVVEQARAIGSVPTSLWDTIAGKKADLQKQLDLYHLNVATHIRKVHQLDARGKREYFESKAEVIHFDAHALLASVKAWTGYQAVHAARARAAGPEEAALAEDIALRTRTELDSFIAETTELVDSLTRELRIVVELPGRGTAPLPSEQKDDSKHRTAAALLAAIQPLADALHPPAAPLDAPAIVCTPGKIELGPYLRIMRWRLDENEDLSAIAFSEPLDSPDLFSAIVSSVTGMFWSPQDKASGKSLIVVTDRRIITADVDTFLAQGQIQDEIPLNQVRYVRTITERRVHVALDLITRDENIRWRFPVDADHEQVQQLAALLREAIVIPAVERGRRQEHDDNADPALTDSSAGLSKSVPD